VNRTDPKSNAPIMMLSAGNGFIMQSEKYSRDNAGQSLKKYILLKQGELAYNHGASKAKQFGCCYELTEPEARIPYVYHCFKINDHEYTPFIAMALNNAKMDKQLKRLVSSSVRMDGLLNISFEDYMSVTLHLPSSTEQKHIADFLKKIDERIAAQEKLLASLKKYKRGLVKALISGTVAFACSENKRWETVRLAEIFTISAGGDIDRQNSSPTYSTSYPYPVYANALTNNGLYGYANYFKVEGDSITVSGRGEVGHAIARHCKYVPIVRLLSLVPKYEDDVDFFAYMINATSIYIESTGVPQLTSPQLGAVKVFRPPILEQKRISSLLLKIDAKIENEERLTFYLEKIRSSMLQQLFI
jgi:type I restriction enzyme S subunit